MGLYVINCPLCTKPHNWFSGNVDQRCPDCKKQALNRYSDATVILSERDWNRFVEIMESPISPNEALKELFKKYKDSI